MDRTDITSNKETPEATEPYFVQYRGKTPTDAVNLLKGMQAAFALAGQDRTVVLVPSNSQNLLFNVAVLSTPEGN